MWARTGWLARIAGSPAAEGVEATGFELDDGGVKAVATAAGTLECETVVAAPGPWAARLWEMLGQPARPHASGDAEDLRFLAR